MVEPKKEPWPRTYIERIALDVYHASGEEDSCWPSGEDALWLGYAVLALAKGTVTTSADVHEAWSAWAAMRYPDGHRSLIPFDDLSRDIQTYDDLYRDAIRKVASTMATP